MITPDTWRDHVFERLRKLHPGERIVAGELFDEVRLHLPLHLVMRNGMRQKKGNKYRKPDVELTVDDVDPERATWYYFAQCLRQMRVAREISGKRLSYPGVNHRVWMYSDLVYLPAVEGKACDKCGGPVIRLRGQSSLPAKYECQVRCWEVPVSQPIVVNEPIEPILETVTVPEVPCLEPPKPPVPIPIIPLVTPEGLIPHMIPRLLRETVIPRKEVAKIVRRHISAHDRAHTSVHTIERQLLECKDNANLLLKLYGVSAPDQEKARQMYIILCNKIIEKQLNRNGFRTLNIVPNSQ